MTPAATIGQFTVNADWDAAQPLSGSALAAYETQGCLLLRDFAPPDLLIHLQYQGEARSATLTAQSPAGDSWRASILSGWPSS